MGQVLYERPREKLRSYGVRFLTLTELIQLILGSGSVHASGAKLARKVQELIIQQRLSYEELIILNGLGDAKACQLLAALEFGKRVGTEGTVMRGKKEVDVQRFIEDARYLPSGTIVCYWLDGTCQEIDRKSYVIQKGEHYGLLTKRVFADVLVAGARSIVVMMVTKNAATMPNAHELGVVSTLQETATLLGVQTVGIYAVYKTVSKKWSKA